MVDKKDIDYQKVFGVIIILTGLFALIFFVPSFLEGSAGQQKYNVSMNASICGTLFGDPTGDVVFGAPQKTLFAVAGSDSYCIAGICDIQNAYITVSGPVERKISLGSSLTIPVVGSCINKSVEVSGLVKGSYTVSLNVTENGSQKVLKTKPLGIN